MSYDKEVKREVVVRKQKEIRRLKNYIENSEILESV